ncbi:MAG: fumarate hydratase [Candidatus Omnitrophica bacterium]|jgi:fumarate hydratase subunit alpha|nr:fumarate hydratase [Candidatus Omnitrophota bacterium]
MKVISANKIKNIVAELCIQANLALREDVFRQLKRAYLVEKNKTAKDVLGAIIKNAQIARKEKLAICQDTGLPCVFVEIGQNLKVSGDIRQAINQGVVLGYKKAYLRNSVIIDPIKREKSGYAPAVIHFDIVRGEKIKLTVFPKGFGCENKTQLKMFKPTAGINEIKKFIIEAVKAVGPDACPPYVIGIGIGGTADYACLLAKKALLRKIRNPKSEIRNKSKMQNSKNYKLENELYSEINKLNIGPMGLGGRNTALAINIETYPTHIAGLPVAINLSCHALRSASKTI